MVKEYADFITQKKALYHDAGIDVDRADINPLLYDFQKDIVEWSLRKGRCALFVDTGLGKTAMQLEWAKWVHDETNQDVLILAPLAVAQQTAREGQKFGVDVTVCKSMSDVRSGINITNYDRLDHFTASRFVGVVLDESSILKAYSGLTCRQIIDTFARTPYKLACSATPAPNDHEELGNHCEFLGIMSRTEMLAHYFTHDGGETSKWRLKGHAAELFWQFVGGWGVAIRKPSDLGYQNDAYDLPPLTITDHCLTIEEDTFHERLFGNEAETLTEQRKIRRQFLNHRCAHASAIVRAEHDEPFIVWCELNDESAALADMIPGAVEVNGSDTREQKEQAMLDFTDGKIRVLVSKPSICGFGMNWQHCARQVFVGVSHSYEQTYQAMRRSWRFGQTRPVNVHLIYTDGEQPVVRNIKRKQNANEEMSNAMVELMCSASGIARATERITDTYNPTKEMELPCWLKTL